MVDTERADVLVESADRPTEQPDGVTQQPDAVTRQPDQGSEQPDPTVMEPDHLDKRTNWCNWTVLLMLLLCIFVITFFRPLGDAQDTGIGQPLPRLKLQPLIGGGRPVTMADLTGRVVLISFWQTGRSQSEEGLSHLAAIENQFRDRSAFRLLSVACGQGDRDNLNALRADAGKILGQRNISMPIYADPNRVSRAAMGKTIGSSDYPTTLILDRLGRIRGVRVGFHAGVEDEMQQLITQLLAEG